MENKDYKAFRKGNPVLIQTSIRYIRELPSDDQGAIQGYSFQADGNVKQHVDPYPIDEDFLRVYDHLKRFDGDESFYVFQKENESQGHPSLSRGCVLKYYPQKRECIISKTDWEKSLVLPVSALHELYNLIEDYCGYKLPHYFPPLKRNNNDENDQEGINLFISHGLSFKSADL